MRNRQTKLTHFARELRRGSTDAERKLWALLRNRTLLGCKFRRQFPIGPYIANFACAFLNTEGYSVLRFWNNDVLLRAESVMEQIFSSLGADGRPSP